MSRKRIHRICVYMLDAARRHVLLQKCKEGPFASQYMPMSVNWNDQETPIESVRRLVSKVTNLDFIYLGYGPSMPLVLDERSIKMFPPFHVQLTVAGENEDYVDHVYLIQAKAAPDFPDGGPLAWFNQTTVKDAPTHVVHLVHHILNVIKH